MCFVYIHIGCVSLCGGETERDRGQYVREVGRQTLTRPLWTEGGGLHPQIDDGVGESEDLQVRSQRFKTLKGQFGGERLVLGEQRHDLAPQFAFVQLLVHTGVRRG